MNAFSPMDVKVSGIVKEVSYSEIKRVASAWVKTVILGRKGGKGLDAD